MNEPQQCEPVEQVAKELGIPAARDLPKLPLAEAVALYQQAWENLVVEMVRAVRQFVMRVWP
jgi:DNA-directed RNA polymerase subunit H (RpoH/RPB5)